MARHDRYIPLFWRLFIPNATLLIAAGVALWVQPARGRIVVLGAGVVLMLLANLIITRQVLKPIVRLTRVTERVDPLDPGHRIDERGSESEATLLARKFNEMLRRLEAERRDSGRRELRAQEEERRRIAAELHDDVGQNLTALAMLCGHAADATENGARDDLLQGRELAMQTVEDVRRLVRSLRPEALDDFGLVPALSALCERVADHTGLRVVPNLDRQLPQLDRDAELVVFRVAQESLTNVVRHAGAGTARVDLRAVDGNVTLTVEDDGAGLPSQARQSQGGLRLMRERAVVVGATLTVGRLGGGGTRVVLRVPAP